MNWNSFILCVLFCGLLLKARAADPVSSREVAMLLRNGEDPQFIIREIARRKLLQAPSEDEEKTLRALNAAPALLQALHDPANLVSADGAAAYAAQMEQRRQALLREAQQEAPSPAISGARPALAERAAPSAPTAGRAANVLPVGRRKPLSLNFTAADGAEVDLAKLHGKVVVVDFWATWCGPCMQEVPHVVAAYQRYHAKGVEVLGISLDKDKATMRKVAAKKEMVWPMYFDGLGWENALAKRFQVQSIPAMWIVDKNGLLATKEGRGNLEANLEVLLAE